jgi:peptidoglycan/LPS O-acetylase OafA/YrhL
MIHCTEQTALVYSLHLFSAPLHPLYAVGSIGLLAIGAGTVYRLVPFYRRELMVEQKTRLTPLDGLRGILCFGVMFHHAAITHAFLQTGRWEETPSVFYVLLGQTSVALFFCITAYLFWSKALSSGGEIAPFSFLRGRWFRIVPLYAFACIVVLFILRSQIHWSRHSTWRSVGKMCLGGLCSWETIGKADVNMVNCGVTWTLQYEWAFYFALPALAMLVRAGNGWRIALIAIACWVIGGVDQDVDFKAYFLSGILAAHVARMPRTAAVLRTFYVAIALLALLAITPLLVPGGYGWWPLIITTTVFIPIACGNSIFGILNLSGLRFMGLVSYSVYLLHGIFLYQCRPFLRQQLSHGDFSYWRGVFVLACGVLMFCSITYRLIEWPFIQLEKMLRGRFAPDRSARPV